MGSVHARVNFPWGIYIPDDSFLDDLADAALLKCRHRENLGENPQHLYPRLRLFPFLRYLPDRFTKRESRGLSTLQ